jgi:hypothetical protein
MFSYPEKQKGFRLCAPSLASALAIPPSIRITARRAKQINSILMIREQRANGHQELAFNARPFVLCGLPLRRLPPGKLFYARRNGKFFLEIVAHPRFGLPFGQDRLIPIWVATLAVTQKSRQVHFESAAQMLDFFRLPRDGPHYRRVVAGFRRIFSATIFFGAEDQLVKNAAIEWARFHFFDRMSLWFNTNGEQPDRENESFPNVIALSDAFYREIDQHRLPAEREVIAALANAPGALDFYLWVLWRSWTVNGVPVRVPITGPGGLSNQLGATQYSLPRRFRHMIVEWLARVKHYWPECPVSVSKDRCVLEVRSSKHSPAVNPVQKPMQKHPRNS